MRIRTTSKKILTLALAMLLAVGTLPQAVLAAGEASPVGTSGEIIAFAPLEDSVASQTIPLGTALEDLDLPQTLTATVEAPAAAEQTNDTGNVQDSGEPAQETPANTDTALDDDLANEDFVSDHDVPDIAGDDEQDGTPSEVQLPEESNADGSANIRLSGSTQQTVSLSVSEWASEPIYDPNTPGTYVFTPVAEGIYLLAEGVRLPVVTVESIASAAPLALSAAIQSGTSDFVLNESVVGFGGDEWYVIGYNGEGVYSDSDTVTLLAKNSFGISSFREYASTTFVGQFNLPNDYNTSTLMGAMMSIAATLPSNKEAELITPRDIGTDGISGDPVYDQKLWPLSFDEYLALGYIPNDNFEGYFWLRSPSGLYNVYMGESGGGHDQNIIYTSYVTTTSPAIRPALQLNLSSKSVVFVSDASGASAKSSVGEDDGLVGMSAPIGAVKFTVLDDAQKLNVFATKAQSTQSGKTLTFSYGNATIGTNQYVSCVLEQGGEVKYYGKLADSGSAASGDLSIPLSGVADGSYTLKIFSEQANGDNQTDFASTPISMTLLVDSGIGTVSNFDGTVLSNDAGIISVAGQSISAGNEAGTASEPKTASITVANSVYTISPANITAATGASVTLYIDSNFTIEDSVNLNVGGGNHLYIKVVSENASVTLYYDVTVTRENTPVITATPTSLSFGSVRTGNTASRSLTIDSSNLTGNIAYTIGGDSSVFSLGASGWNAASGGTLQVTFTPTQARNFAASIEFTGPGATPVTVTLSGIGYTSVSSGSGGSNSDDSSSTSTVTILPAAQPDWPTIGSVSGKVQGVTFIVTDRLVKAALEKARTEAKAKNRTAYGIGAQVALDVPSATGLTVTLERAALNRLVSEEAKHFEITGTPVGMTFDAKALAELQRQSTGDVAISLKPITVEGVRNTYDITLSWLKDGRTVNITSLGTGSVNLSIPCAPGKNEAAGYLYAVYVDDKGKVSRIADSSYDANNGSIMFSTDHFSVYGVGYAAPSAKFTDIVKHWAKESIDYVVGRGLLSGTSETTFAPDAAMTRAMLVMALGRQAGVDEKAYTGCNFTDMKTDSPFRPYIEWAYSKGIVRGIGNQQFAPDRAITREEIAAILQNYAKATGYKLPLTHEAAAYSDASSIGGTYKTAVTAMQQAGIMMGGTNNKFDPKSNATRAEVSAMLYRYIRLTIDPATAQGWAKNDAGQWLYYKNSKALTSTQTIEGVKYFFNTDGTLKTGWVQDGGSWRFYSGNKLLVGWWNIGANGDNKDYYFDTYGNMISGKWLQIEGKWYYFNANGTLARSTKIDDYEVDENGVRKEK